MVEAVAQLVVEDVETGFCGAVVECEKTAGGARRAQVARASRIYVEGRHDAELVERIWGADLRAVAVVVEHLGGIDDLAGKVGDFGPAPDRHLGVLVDHLVPGARNRGSRRR